MDPPVSEREGAVVFFLVRHGAWRYAVRMSRSGKGSIMSGVYCQNGVHDGVVDWSRAREAYLALARQEAATESQCGKRRGTKTSAELSFSVHETGSVMNVKQLTESCRRRQKYDWVSKSARRCEVRR